jgi:hypothetical protein
MEMAYIVFDARLAHSTPKARHVPAGLYALLGGTLAALSFAGWGFWMINAVVPGAIQGMVQVFGGA